MAPSPVTRTVRRSFASASFLRRHGNADTGADGVERNAQRSAHRIRFLRATGTDADRLSGEWCRFCRATTGKDFMWISGVNIPD